MGTTTLAILSLLPIATVAVFLVVLRWPASRAMPLTYAVAAVLALFVWQIPGVQVAAATINGLIVALTLLYIIFGAILLLNTLQESGALRTIRRGFTDISKELALAHHPVHRNSGAIYVGGTIMDMGVWVFMEENEGLVKRGFDQVVPDGQIYCYQGAISSERGQGPPMFPGRLLISLTSETEMLVD